MMALSVVKHICFGCGVSSHSISGVKLQQSPRGSSIFGFPAKPLVRASRLYIEHSWLVGQSENGRRTFLHNKRRFRIEQRQGDRGIVSVPDRK